MQDRATNEVMVAEQQLKTLIINRIARAAWQEHHAPQSMREKILTFRLQNWDGNWCAYADIYWCKQSMELLVSLLLNVAAAYQLV